MERQNLTLEQNLILFMTKSYIENHGINSLDANTIDKIRFLSKELSHDKEQAKEEQEEKKSYPPFGAWMSEKTIRILHNRTGVDTPEQLVEYDFKNGHIYGFLPNIELLQYAMVAGIKLKNYLY